MLLAQALVEEGGGVGREEGVCWKEVCMFPLVSLASVTAFLCGPLGILLPTPGGGEMGGGEEE